MIKSGKKRWRRLILSPWRGPIEKIHPSIHSFIGFQQKSTKQNKTKSKIGVSFTNHDVRFPHAYLFFLILQIQISYFILFHPSSLSSPSLLSTTKETKPFLHFSPQVNSLIFFISLLSLISIFTLLSFPFFRWIWSNFMLLFLNSWFPFVLWFCSEFITPLYLPLHVDTGNCIFQRTRFTKIFLLYVEGMA